MTVKSLSYARHKIAAGGMGEVYKDWLPLPDGTYRPIAVKRLRSEHTTDPDMVARFQREIALSLSITGDHPNLPTARFVRHTPHGPELVMDFVAGPSVEQVRTVLRGNWPLIRTIAYDLLSTLDHIHSMSLLHRDVSPKNILISPRGLVMLIDLSLAKPIDTPPSCEFCGSLPYVAPETLVQTPASPAADLYSLGAVLYVLLTSRFPYGETLAKIRIRAQAGTPPIPPGVPADIAQLVGGLIAPRPGDRLTAAEAHALLSEPPDGSIVAEFAAANCPSTPPSLTRKKGTFRSWSLPRSLHFLRNGPWVAILLAVVVIAVILIWPDSPTTDPFYDHDFYDQR